MDKETERMIILWRLGAYTYHQPCTKCGKEVSRAHALQCSGQEEQLQYEFAEENEEYTNSQEKNQGQLFINWLLNRLDRLFNSQETEKKNQAQIWAEKLATAIRHIRNTCGYDPAASRPQGIYRRQQKKRARRKQQRRSWFQELQDHVRTTTISNNNCQQPIMAVFEPP